MADDFQLYDTNLHRPDPEVVWTKPKPYVKKLYIPIDDAIEYIRNVQTQGRSGMFGHRLFIDYGVNTDNQHTINCWMNMYLKHSCNPQKEYFNKLQKRVLDRRDYYIYKNSGIKLF